MKYQPYQDYITIQNQWLPQIPTTWQIARLKFVSRINPTKSEIAYLPDNLNVSFLPMELIGDDGTLQLTETRKIGEVSGGFTYFRDGDIIVAKITPCFENGKGALVRNLVNGIGFGTTELHVLRPSADLYPKFLYYIIHSELFRETGTALMVGAAGQKRVPTEFVADFVVGIPTLSEQRAIAAFLERETATIDTLIAKKRELIERLQEKRTALINHAVIKGLDPSLPMRDSGVEWLGEIPAHWQTIRSKWLFALRKTKAYENDRQLTVSQKYGPIFQEDFVELEGRRVMEVIRGADILQHIEPNDFVISMRSFQGGIEYCKLSGSVSSAYVVLIPAKSVHSGYFSYLLKSIQYIQALQGTTNLVRDGQAIRYSNFTLVDLPVLPLQEQARIARFLDQELAKIDALLQKTEVMINRLGEYRTALVSAAVTGKIDVRNYGQRRP